MTNHPNRGKTAKSTEIAVLVTTAHRGVFFGYATDYMGKSIELRSARNCIYWPVANKGFLGLAMMGPVSGARIGPAADVLIHDVTSVTKCTDEAVAAWEKAPWSRG